MSGRRNQRSAEAEGYRKLYRTTRWRAVRAAQLRAEPLCAMCLQMGKTRAATVADHKRAHRGDEALFWDPDNLQSLCAPHHDAARQAEERRGFVIGNGLDGRPLDPSHPWHRG